MSTDLKDSAAHVFLRFDGDGLPDTEWLGTHEKHARYRGEIVRADALKWMMDAFNRHTVLSDDKTAVQAGSYRIFEFAVSLAWARLYRKCALSPVLPDARNPSDDEVARDEIAACQGNFTALVAWADEMESYGPLGRWTATLPETVPQEMEQFAEGYTSVLNGLSEFPDHSKALPTYSRALGVLIRSGDDDFAAGAGSVYAWQTILASHR